MGIMSLVFLAPMMPATVATASTSPLGAAAARMMPVSPATAHDRAGQGTTFAGRLVADVDHARASARVEV